VFLLRPVDKAGYTHHVFCVRNILICRIVSCRKGRNYRSINFLWCVKNNNTTIRCSCSDRL